MTQENTQESYTREDIEKAASEGNPAAQFELSRIYSDENNIEASMENLSLAVQNGFPAALTTSAIFILTRQGFRYDAVHAMENLEQASLRGHEDGSLIYAHLTHAGIGVNADSDKAISILVTAARRNSAHALCEIAALMMMNNIMAKQGAIMMESAARHGSVVAAYLIASELKDLAEDGNDNALHRRINFLYMAARGGNSMAEAEFMAYGEDVINLAMSNIEPASLTPPQFDWGRITNALSALKMLDAPSVEKIGSGGKVRLVKSILSKLERNYLMAASIPMLVFSSQGRTEEEIAEEKPDAEKLAKLLPKKAVSHFNFLSSDVIVQSIEAKVAAAAGYEVSHSEKLEVLFERPEGKIDEDSEEVKAQITIEEDILQKHCGAQVKKIIIGLGEGHDGGLSLISAADVSHDLAAGDMLVVDLSKDIKDTQESDLQQGFKWTANIWVREKLVPEVFED